MRLAIFHLFDIGLGMGATAIAFVAFWYSFTQAKAKGLETSDALAEAQFADGIIALGDKATDLFDVFDVLMAKHGGEFVKHPRWKFVQEWGRQSGEIFDEAKAKKLWQDLKAAHDIDKMIDKAGHLPPEAIAKTKQIIQKVDAAEK